MAGEPGQPDTAAELVGRLSTGKELTKAERGRLRRRLTVAPRKLTDAFLAVAPRIPVRDLATLQEHHHGLWGERLADSLVKTAANATTAVGAAGGALGAIQFAAPPLLLTAPAQLTAETLAVASIELKMVAELHAVYGAEVPGSGLQRAQTFAVAWAKRRGINPLAPGTITIALGTATRTALRKRLMGVLGRHLTTLGPFLTGAAAGGTLNRIATRRLAEAVRADLRRHHALPASH